MAKKAVEMEQVSIALTCRTFSISESGYRYERKLSDENVEIADWLVRLTSTYRSWGFGLCYLYLRNVKGFGWNKTRVRRISRDLELNLRGNHPIFHGTENWTTRDLFQFHGRCDHADGLIGSIVVVNP